MARYKAILFAPDGDWVTDCRDSESIDEVWEQIEDMGSRWFFYPIRMVIRDRGTVTTSNQRIVQAPAVFDWAEGHTIRVVARNISDNPEWIAAVLTP